MKVAPPLRQVRVGPELAGGALDGAVRAAFELSWNRARDLVRRGKVQVDGKTVTDPVARVRAGVTVTLDLAAPDPRTLASALPPGAIVYVDPHVVVVDKPSGISTVPYVPEGMGASIAKRAGAFEEATLDERVRTALAKRTAKRSGNKGAPPSLGVVHRLDKETSGLVVFTRTWEAKRALSQAFRVHTVHRKYLALVHGHPTSATITSHFVEDRGDGVRGSVEKRRGRARPIGNEFTQRAVTHIELLERFAAGASGIETALVACRLETGRTHQIRIHLAEAGHSVLGEKVYVRGHDGPFVPAPRVMLHAAELGFDHPGTERPMRWTSPLPADFEEMQAFLRG